MLRFVSFAFFMVLYAAIGSADSVYKCEGVFQTRPCDDTALPLFSSPNKEPVVYNIDLAGAQPLHTPPTPPPALEPPEFSEEKCPVHQEMLRKGWMIIHYGIEGTSPDNPKYYPFAREVTSGGCVIRDDSKYYQEVFYCESCRKARSKILSSREKKRELARNSTESKVLEELLQGDELLIFPELARNSNLSTSQIKQIFGWFKSSRAFRDRAKQALVPEPGVNNDEDSVGAMTLAGLAGNSNTPVAILRKLSKFQIDRIGSWDMIHQELAENVNTPDDVLLTLFARTRGQRFNNNFRAVQDKLALNPKLSAEALESIRREASDQDPGPYNESVFFHLAGNTSLSDESLRAILKRQHFIIDPRNIGKNSLRIANWFVKDMDQARREYGEYALSSILCHVAKDPETPRDLLEKLTSIPGQHSCWPEKGTFGSLAAKTLAR